MEEPSLVDGIAIIGMAGRFPQSKNVNEFWKHLYAGKELISFFSDEELIQEGIDFQTLKDPHYIKAKGMLEDIDCFDADFFGYSPKEAICMDPQQRIIIECAWEALETAGYCPDQSSDVIGVFVGGSLSSYFLFNVFPYLRQSLERHQEEMMMVIGNEKDFLASRISYKLNLKGPSKVIQTACSSSLVAVIDACHSLLSHQCDLALAGGVSVSSPQKSGYFYTKEGIYSPNGQCRPFDAAGAGTLGGNGAGIVVLKRLEDAINEGATISAVIKGFAINNDGKEKVGYTAPSIEGQSRVILAAQTFANIHPRSISYIEAHGTGTLLGDPIEVSALTRAFRMQTNENQFCALGSVKSNIGHLDAAAGIAGLIKVVLSLQHRHIPASLHFEKANPKINFEGTPFFVNHQLTNWNPSITPLRAGVSSFGIGGTNAHLIVEEAPSLSQSKGQAESKEHLFVLSAHTPEALLELVKIFIAQLPLIPYSIADIAYTLQIGRKNMDHKIFFIGSHSNEIIESMKEYVTSGKPQRNEKETFNIKQPLHDIGLRWMKGEWIDWNKLHHEKRIRVPLPTYPFAKTRFWMPFQGGLAEKNQKPTSSFLISNQKAKLDVIPPKNKLEKLFLEIWKQVLQSSEISVEDNYFQLGGDSLMALEIAGEIRKRLYIDLSIQHFFKNTTIRSLAEETKEILIEKIESFSEEEAHQILEQIKD